MSSPGNTFGINSVNGRPKINKIIVYLFFSFLIFDKTYKNIIFLQIFAEFCTNVFKRKAGDLELGVKREY